MSDKIRGRVKWFDKSEGFGFIESGGKKYFAHINAVEGNRFTTLKQGAPVSFKPIQGAKSLIAESIEVI